jgi:hypothetical protein
MLQFPGIIRIIFLRHCSTVSPPRMTGALLLYALAPEAMSGNSMFRNAETLDNFGRQCGRQISSALVIFILLATPASATDAVTVCHQALTPFSDRP